jgi:ATP-dependent protease HslVU (ClpYQ) peptidase subunit
VKRWKIKIPKLLSFSFYLLSSFGGIAQWLEQSAHNRLVAGSSPATPTIKKSNLSLERRRDFFVYNHHNFSNINVMTTCIALQHRDSVFLIADGRITRWDMIMMEDAQKILSYHDYNIMTSGLVVVSQILEHWHTWRSIHLSSDILHLQDELIQLLKDKQMEIYLKETEIILATKLWLYYYSWSRQKWEAFTHYVAIGSGANHATAFLDAHYDHTLWSWDTFLDQYGPKNMLEQALLCSAWHDVGTGSRVTSLTF